MRVLSVVHEPGSTGGGGLFEDLVEERGDRLERGSGSRTTPRRPTPRRATTRSWSSAARCTPTRTPSIPGSRTRPRSSARPSTGEVPLFGVCLGAQLIARAVGARHRPAPATPEVGWHEVALNDAGRADPVSACFPSGSTPSSGTTTASSSRPAPSCSRRTRRRSRPSGSASARGASSSSRGHGHMLDHWFAEGEAELSDAAAVRSRRTTPPDLERRTAGGSAGRSSTPRAG